MIPAANMQRTTTAATTIPTMAPVDILSDGVVVVTVIAGVVLSAAAGRAMICDGAFSTHVFWETEKLEYS